MWILEDAVNNSTNKVVVPRDGVITISKPDTARVNAYVNDAATPTQQVAVKAGDTVYFKLTNYKKGETPIGIMYEDVSDVIMLPGKVSDAQMSKVIAVNSEPLAIISETTKEDDMTPQDTINLFANPNQGGTGGAMGAGLGAGLLGGVLGGALLNNNGGGLLGGGNNNGAASTLVVENAIAASTALSNARFDAQAQAAINASVERTNAATLLAIATGNSALGVEIAKGQGEVNTQNALNAAALGVQIQKTAGDTQTQVATQTAAIGVQNERTAAANALANAMGQRDIVSLIAAEAAANARQTSDLQYALSTQITADGNQTRALITTNNNDELNRRLVDAQNQIIELRGDNRMNERTRGIEITTTNNINQMQQQQQQQQQYDRLYGYISTLAQSIQATNQAINVGSGTQTANPLNTNTQIR
jgi:hypothetical protein